MSVYEELAQLYEETPKRFFPFKMMQKKININLYPAELVLSCKFFLEGRTEKKI
jgi:hypothetical protein